MQYLEYYQSANRHLEVCNIIPQLGIRIVHKKVGSLTNILYLYR